MNQVERLGVVGLLPILVAGALFTYPSLTNSPSSLEGRAPAADIVLAAENPHVSEWREDADAADGVVDLYGNEVTEAIATYTLDQAGSLYELHSPQTELPRLGIPKS